MPVPDPRSLPHAPSTPRQPAGAQALAARARVLATPCGDGELIWHAWGDGPPVVLLHGGAGSWTHWVRNVDALVQAGWRVLAADVPGFGDSASAPDDRDADGTVAPLAAGLRAVAGDALPVRMVGFSFGGLCAGLLAAAEPTLVRHLVLVGAPALGINGTRIALTPWRGLDHPQARAAAHRANLAALMLARDASIDDEAVALQALNAERDHMRRRRLFLTDILARTLPTLACPVDAIYGAQDALYRDRLERLRAVLCDPPLVRELVLIDEGGHWIGYEEPARFDAALLRLLGPAG